MSDYTLEAVGRRLERLEAIDEIRRLKLRYAALCDQGYPGDQIGPLYAEDAVFDGGPFGVFEGRQAIADFYAGTSEGMPWAVHFMTNDVIEVADDLQTATGTWHLPTAVTLASESGPRPMWIFGTETDEYRKIDGAWRFSRVTFALAMASDTRLGWHEELVQL